MYIDVTVNKVYAPCFGDVYAHELWIVTTCTSSNNICLATAEGKLNIALMNKAWSYKIKDHDCVYLSYL